MKNLDNIFSEYIRKRDADCFDKKLDLIPVSKQVNREELISLLNTKKKDRLFCFHKWVYWRFNCASKVHRVCRKCYKKQQNRDVLKAGILWIKETVMR